MSDKVTLIYTTADANGTEVQKTVTNVNEHATDAELKTFAAKLAGLSDNTFVGAARVERREITDADTATNFKVTPSVIKHNLIKDAGSIACIAFSYNGDVRVPTVTGKKLSYLSFDVGQLGMTITNTATQTQFNGGADCTFTLTLPAEGRYAAASVDVTITGCSASNIVDI